MAGSTEGKISADMAIAWYIHKHYPEIKVDFILPGEISTERLQSNVCNFILGYDISDAMTEGAVKFAVVSDAFSTCGNIFPNWSILNAIHMKSEYMGNGQRLGVPMAPTIFAKRDNRDPGALLAQIEARGWKEFFMKQSWTFGSVGCKKFSVQACRDNSSLLEEYFEEHAESPEYVVQEFIEGFTRNWEVRCYWFNGEFLYAIANRALVSCASGEKVGMITEDEIPEEFLENAKRIGKQALDCLPPMTTADGKSVGMTVIRTDIGCCDSKINDKDTHWDPSKKTYFLNEIEYASATYFSRVLKFDSIPVFAKHFAEKALEICRKTESTAAGKLCSNGGYIAAGMETADTLPPAAVSPGNTSTISSQSSETAAARPDCDALLQVFEQEQRTAMCK